MRAASIFAVWCFAIGCGDNKAAPVDAQLPPDGPAKPQCSDGLDNDHDGKIDYPQDPGCYAPQADDERDDCPDGPHCPECGNGRDDDGNGKIDYPADPGCTAAGDTDEFMHSDIACGTGLHIKPLPPIETDTGTLDATSTASMTTTCGTAAGVPAIAYEIHLSHPKVMVASTVGSTMDTVLDLRRANCSANDAELTCNDDAAADHTSKITKALDAGNYYLLVMGKDAAATGTYNLTVMFQAGAGETCTMDSQCGPGLVCRIPVGDTQMRCEPPRCSDGVDDDGDGKADYPTDPGCASPDDNDETDDCPGGPMCPACSNGTDDDGDGQTDYPNDTACTSAAGNSEACNTEQDPILNLTNGTTNDNMTGAHDDHDPSCGGNGGVDRLFTLKVPTVRTITIDTIGTSFDTVLSLLPPSCGEPSLVCDDDSGGSGNTSKLTRTNLAAGVYVVAVDAYSATTTLGPFDVHITGTIAPGGACNPADTLNGALACPTENPCEGSPGALRCRPNLCSDGIDNDGDGKIDYPLDPGCTSADDNTEDDPCPGAGCPQCADGIDNDGDGHIDYPADTTCTSASGTTESCSSSEPITQLTLPATSGTTVGATNDSIPSCGSTTTQSAPDVMYQLDLPAVTALDINLDPVSFDSAHYLLPASCSGAPIKCSDPAAMAVGALGAGTYYLVVDGWSSGSGTFTVNVSGTIAPGASCESPLAQSGALNCPITSACVGPPGSRTCRVAQCSDGIDNNGDGLIDFPNDPGCASPNDQTEDTVCPGPACPACSNGIDDDGDGLIDFPMDSGCTAASGHTEGFCGADQDHGGVITHPTTIGDLASAHADLSESCQSSTGNDRTYELDLPVPVASLVIDTEGSAVTNTVLGVRDAACTPVACDDDSGTGSLSQVTLTNVAARSYAITVDGYGSSNNGIYKLNVHGTVANGTACTSPLFATGVLACGAGATCTGGVCH